MNVKYEQEGDERPQKKRKTGKNAGSSQPGVRLLFLFLHPQCSS